MIADRSLVVTEPITPLIVDTKGACELLGGISKQQLLRIVDAGHLAVIRLPGGRDRRGYATGEPSRRVYYSVDDIRRLITRSSERQAPAANNVVTMTVRRRA